MPDANEVRAARSRIVTWLADYEHWYEQLGPVNNDAIGVLFAALDATRTNVTLERLVAAHGEVTLTMIEGRFIAYLGAGTTNDPEGSGASVDEAVRRLDVDVDARTLAADLDWKED